MAKDAVVKFPEANDFCCNCQNKKPIKIKQVKLAHGVTIPQPANALMYDHTLYKITLEGEFFRIFSQDNKNNMIEPLFVHVSKTEYHKRWENE